MKPCEVKMRIKLSLAAAFLLLIIAGCSSRSLLRAPDNPDLQPFHDKVSITLPSGKSSGIGSIQVPEGKRLVIEYITMSAFVPMGSGQRPLITIQAVTNGTGILHTPAIATHAGMPVNGVQADYFVGSQAVKLYADPGTSLVIGTSRTGSTKGSAAIDVSLSGHFVDLR